MTNDASFAYRIPGSSVPSHSLAASEADKCVHAYQLGRACAIPYPVQVKLMVMTLHHFLLMCCAPCNIHYRRTGRLTTRQPEHTSSTGPCSAIRDNILTLSCYCISDIVTLNVPLVVSAETRGFCGTRHVHGRAMVYVTRGSYSNHCTCIP